MSFKVGDRVRIVADVAERWGGRYAADRVHVITEIPPNSRSPYSARIKARIKSEDGTVGLVYFREIEAVEPQFVNVIEARSIWVTLPGDNAGHKLTEDEARTLFRQLEEVV